MIASVRFFETPKIRAVSKGVAGRLLSTLIGCRIQLLYAVQTLVIPNRAESPVRNPL
jgi:hypothetical protein